MSQEKIDRYKEEKANRKKAVAKQKRNSIIAKVAGVVVILALIVWIGWSGYRTHQENKEYEAMMSSFNEMMATYQNQSSSNGATSSSGVNLEQDPSNVTTGDETKADETTSEHDHDHEDETTTAAE